MSERSGEGEQTISDDLEDARRRELIEKHKHSEGWEAVLEARDRVYREFFTAGTTDHHYEPDANELNKALNIEVLKVSAALNDPENLSFDDVRYLIEVGILTEWEKRSSSVNKNLGLGESAILAAFSSHSVSELDVIPAGAESSE